MQGLTEWPPAHLLQCSFFLQCCCSAPQPPSLNMFPQQVTLLLRDPYLCKDINELHCNSRYLKVRRGRADDGCISLSVA
jgi:hypothetical protein